MKVEILSQLQNIGSNVTNIHRTNGGEVYNAIVRWTRDTIELLREEVYNVGAKATLNLMQSIKPVEYPPDGDKVKIEITADYYWKFVNYGVDGVDFKRGYPYSFRFIRPSKRHVEAIKKWIVDVAATNNDVRPNLTAEANTRAFAYRIATSTKKRGITARPFVQNVLTDDRIKELVVDIAKSTGKEIILRYFGEMTNISTTRK